MTAFEVFHRGKRLCKAGIGSDGVLSAAVTLATLPRAGSKSRDDLFVQVGGLHSPSREHRSWVYKSLAVGDEIIIRITSANRVDSPKSRKRDSMKKIKDQNGKIVRRLASKLGWKIDENPA